MRTFSSLTRFKMSWMDEIARCIKTRVLMLRVAKRRELWGSWSKLKTLNLRGIVQTPYLECAKRNELIMATFGSWGCFQTQSRVTLARTGNITLGRWRLESSDFTSNKTTLKSISHLFHNCPNLRLRWIVLLVRSPTPQFWVLRENEDENHQHEFTWRRAWAMKFEQRSQYRNQDLFQSRRDNTSIGRSILLSRISDRKCSQVFRLKIFKSNSHSQMGILSCLSLDQSWVPSSCIFKHHLLYTVLGVCLLSFLVYAFVWEAVPIHRLFAIPLEIVVRLLFSIWSFSSYLWRGRQS